MLHKALSNELRGEILTILSERKASPYEIARELEENPSSVEYHIRKLLEFGCAELVDERSVRGATEHFYRATELHFVATEDWESLDPATKSSEVGQFMQAQIDAFVKWGRKVGRNNRFHLTMTPASLDERGCEETMEILDRARQEVEEAVAASNGRIAETGVPEEAFTLAISFFETPSG